MNESSFDETFRNLSRPLLVAGVGNILKGDDGAGPLLVRRLKEEGASVTAVDCGETPENHTSLLSSHRDGTIILVDAAAMGDVPGEIRLLRPEDLGDSGFFTHAGPLSLLIEFLRLQGSAPVMLCGIQPKSVRLGEAMSPEVEAAVERLLHHLLTQ